MPLKEPLRDRVDSETPTSIRARVSSFFISYKICKSSRAHRKRRDLYRAFKPAQPWSIV